MRTAKPPGNCGACDDCLDERDRPTPPPAPAGPPGENSPKKVIIDPDAYRGGGAADAQPECFCDFIVNPRDASGHSTACLCHPRYRQKGARRRPAPPGSGAP